MAWSISRTNMQIWANRCSVVYVMIPFQALVDEFVKSRNFMEYVIPAKAGIQLFEGVLDPGFRRGDGPKDFLRDHLN
jgi:hypothetical protein